MSRIHQIVDAFCDMGSLGSRAHQASGGGAWLSGPQGLSLTTGGHPPPGILRSVTERDVRRLPLWF